MEGEGAVYIFISEFQTELLCGMEDYSIKMKSTKIVPPALLKLGMFCP